MLFLTDVDHVSFEKAIGTRQNNLQSATVSLQVVIGLCKRKETAALISQNRRQNNELNVRRKSSAPSNGFFLSPDGAVFDSSFVSPQMAIKQPIKRL